MTYIFVLISYKHFDTFKKFDILLNFFKGGEGMERKKVAGTEWDQLPGGTAHLIFRSSGWATFRTSLNLLNQAQVTSGYEMIPILAYKPLISHQEIKEHTHSESVFLLEFVQVR